MKRSCIALAFVGLLYLTSGILAFGISGEYPHPANRLFNIKTADIVADVETLLQLARQQGTDYLATKDEKQKKAVKKTIEDAEKLAKKAVKDTPNCEKCFEVLTQTYFYKTYFGFSKDYDDCVEAATKGLAQFPASGRLNYLRGYAYFNSFRYSEANKSLKAALLVVDPTTAAQITTVLQQSQQAFLTNWNRQANFYQSPESRIERYNPQIFRNEVAFQVTPEFEMQLGAQGFAAITSGAPVVNDPEIQKYLEELVQRITSKSPGSSFSYRITLVNSPEVNAVTPPGHVIVYTGLIGFAENEAQLAGVLAHELAHNYGHHQARAVIKNYQAQMVANAVMNAINPQNAWARILGSIGTNVGLTLFSRAYSRFEEKEADHYGAHLMFNAGYSPLDASQFFLRMSKLGGKTPPKFLSTHPPMLDRANYVMDYLDSFPSEGREFRTDSEDFKRIRARIVPAQRSSGILPPF